MSPRLPARTLLRDAPDALPFGSTSDSGTRRRVGRDAGPEPASVDELRRPRQQLLDQHPELRLVEWPSAPDRSARSGFAPLSPLVAGVARSSEAGVSSRYPRRQRHHRCCTEQEARRRRLSQSRSRSQPANAQDSTIQGHGSGQRYVLLSDSHVRPEHGRLGGDFVATWQQQQTHVGQVEAMPLHELRRLRQQLLDRHPELRRVEMGLPFGLR